MVVNAVVKMQWVVPHSLAQPGLRVQIMEGLVQRLIWQRCSRSIEALQMYFTFCNNNPPARVTALEATEQKLNILFEWP